MRAIILSILISTQFLSSVQAQTPLKQWTSEEKASIMRSLDSTQETIRALISPLTEKQFFYRPDSNTWSVNDIIEHLGLIEEGYVREFWWATSQPEMPASYQDSTKGGDEKAIAYATDPAKGHARGTNLPLKRYCDKETCWRVFTTARTLSKDFFVRNNSLNMRAYYVFRKDASGKRDIRDLHQQALWMLSHCIRHSEQIRQLINDPRFPKAMKKR
ncbi:DinB family protein [Terrimonas sp. NA20]|uniref:DinB family protein n=1 Tax=Terrimonas ginsenosidimutans TaxID=2908004 RepID=A0ABS9KRS4_9BACT|nr:DinB family protein [Terrimonas ginsenosidimutans]MCG2615037.1 DinB family protein [Terrimonas ginsenosidimutans]